MNYFTSGMKIFIISLTILILIESTIAIRGGRVGGAKGGFRSGGNNGRNSKDRKKDKMQLHDIEERVDEIVDQVIAGNWTQSENSTYEYMSNLLEINQAYAPLQKKSSAPTFFKESLLIFFLTFISLISV